MKRKLTVIGATGKLAIPIIKRLQENGVVVTAIVRNIEKAKEVLPLDTEILVANLEDKESLISALQGTEYLYLNLSAHESEAKFQTEIDGVRNILEAAKETPVKQIIKISGLGALHPEFNLKGEVYNANVVRKTGHLLIKESEIDYTIFHPTWFLNALPWFIKDNQFLVYGKDEHPFYWTNTSDFADQITAAIGNKASFKKEFAVQGNKAMTFEQAATQFISTYNPDLELIKIPITTEMGRFGLLLSYYENFREKFVADKTWALLGEPTVAFDDFINHTLK